MKRTKSYFTLLSVFLILATLNTPLYSQTKTIKKPKNIIFLIGDGMGTAQVYSALVAKKDKLNMARCKHIGFHKTYSKNKFITDSAAGATAFSTGQKTNNGFLALDSSKNYLPTILEMASKKGLSTGLVVTCAVTHATPAAFVAHVESRDNYEEIAKWYLKSDVTVLLGGGRNHFEKRKDSLNLSDSLRAKGYQVVYNPSDMVRITKGKIAGLFYPEHPPKISEGRGNLLSLETAKAISILNQNKKGFFMMIEGSQIDWGGHNNDMDYIVKETVDFDDVVGQVLDFAEKDGNTLVVITADHETGGLAISGGDFKEGKVEGKFIAKDHTGIMVPIFAFGPGADEFMGIIENTDIFIKFNSLLFGK